MNNLDKLRKQIEEKERKEQEKMRGEYEDNFMSRLYREKEEVPIMGSIVIFISKILKKFNSLSLFADFAYLFEKTIFYIEDRVEDIIGEDSNKIVFYGQTRNRLIALIILAFFIAALLLILKIITLIILISL